ncbi:hypothetical protein Sango_1552500 [Sesamum angolense]|uniref:RNase H type-1 domain-containing protein n=1 Tax=Sesamum angolense TaxID=2727404 RepID=A0AAE2BTF7_9LAMI|nr:hypothetical protein Sango_1552500 [Sesamum angolense]
MRVWGQWRVFPRIHGKPMRHRDQPSKDQDYLGHGTPININEVQQLTGRMAALSQFISKSIEKGLPLFKTLRKVKNFEWIEECQQVFEELKAYLAKLPLLVKPIPGLGLGRLRIRNDRNNPGRSSLKETLVTPSGRILHRTREWSRRSNYLPQGEDMEFAIKFDFKASNNEAEYEGLVLGMKIAQDAGASHLLAYSDSELIVKQVNGEVKQPGKTS